MTRIHLFCEGQTEENFVNKVLSPYFNSQGITLNPITLKGNFKIDRVVSHIRKTMMNDTKSYASTFFDFYGLHDSFPGKKEASQMNTMEEKRVVFMKQFQDEIDQSFQSKQEQDMLRRFIPYVQMYEFEALLFSNPTVLAESLELEEKMKQQQLYYKIQHIVKQFESPEHINNSKDTAPSKRILKIAPQYNKVFTGSLAANSMGLECIRKHCFYFNQWLEQLEKLSPITP